MQRIRDDKMFEFCLQLLSLKLGELIHSFESLCYSFKGTSLKKKGEKKYIKMLIPWFTVTSSMASYSYTYGEIQNL